MANVDKQLSDILDALNDLQGSMMKIKKDMKTLNDKIDRVEQTVHTIKSRQN